jgi:hypothetical protein
MTWRRLFGSWAILATAAGAQSGAEGHFRPAGTGVKRLQLCDGACYKGTNQRFWSPSMTSNDKVEISFANLSLEPIEIDEALKIEVPAAKFHADTRNKVKTDRRVTADRRQVLRFEADRRSGKERRPKKTWEPGKNI